MAIYDINTIYSRYKDFVGSHYCELKKKVESIIERNRLSSVMNDAKWLRLQTAILSTPGFEPAYRVRLLTDDAGPSAIGGEIPAYSGCWELLYENWEYAPPPFFNIEWMAIQPVCKIYRGRLVKPEMIDKSDVLADILHTCRIPFEKEDEHTFVIYGYR